MFKRVMTFANLTAALTFSAGHILGRDIDVRIDPRIAAGRKRSVLRMGSRNRYTGEDLRAIRAGTHAKHGGVREMARRVRQMPAKALDPYRVMRENLAEMGRLMAGSDIGARMAEVANAAGAEIMTAYRGLFLTADGKARADSYIPKRLRLAHPTIASRLDAERTRLSAA